MHSSVLTSRASEDAAARSAARAVNVDLDALRTHVNGRLHALVPRTGMDQGRLSEAIHSALLAPGKRLRPLCMILAGYDLGCHDATLPDLGCAVEMVHTASLLLDDLPCMDDAKLRRGAPATHVRYGESTAMLAAIAMLSRAFEIVSTLRDVPPDVRAHLVSLLAAAVGTGGLVGGQFYDLQHKETDESVQRLVSTGDLKTGALFVAAVGMVSAVAGAPHVQARALQSYAAQLGQAFQLLDDVLDGEASAEVLGKDVEQDIGKSTLGRALGKDGARERLVSHVAAMEEALHVVDGGEGALRALTHVIFKQYAGIDSGPVSAQRA